MNNIKVLVPLPSYGFDPTEVAIPWNILTENNINIVFATPNGTKGEADTKMLRGNNLGIWKTILQARQDAVVAYEKMEQDESFCNPIKYEDIDKHNFEAILLPGGHDKGVKEYLESKILQQTVVDFFKKQKPVGAICHGVVLLARSIDPNTGKSVIHNYQTTSLLKSQELLAYNLTKMWLKDYYLTYPEITVEAEVCAALSNTKNFHEGPTPLFRDNHKHLSRGFVVKDRNYISARWPGDAYRFSLDFIKMVKKEN